ncbi:hypothetical protein GM658_16465 [Pseudoduganella eburnea]|uniref:Uncharacterized protein n=1 Tax=Massilia eburnea TaxID=1776165 RepID=A0A6L6QJB6_9BURK|nr:hypothetical protein [Massilia eburnea]MTW12200.1 hypothetical protein [Massilia eburnea]
MIQLHAEALLVAAMLVLYLYDSAQLLYSNEGVLAATLGGRWSLHFGAEHYTLRGKQPFIPNPLLPHRPVFLLHWKQQLPAAKGAPQRWTPPPLGPYKVLAPLVWLMALALFGLIPAGLFTRYGNSAVAAGILLFYASALLALAVVWFKRHALQLSPRQVGALAFESLTCPPFALNLIRHISWNVRPTEDLVSASRRLLRKDNWSVTLPAVIKRIDNALAYEDEGTPRAQTLTEFQASLTRELNSLA